MIHIHKWEEKGECFALLPKMNVPSEVGMKGTIQECECGSKRWVHPTRKDLQSVEVTES